MTWLLWRQHRAQAFVASVALILFGLAVWVTGVHMAHTYQDAVRNCPANGVCDLLGNLFRGDGAIVDTVHLSIAVPILLGTFLGATLIARETDQATNVLVWTQTVTRRQWLAGKVAMALVATLAWSTAVSALVTWWSGTPNSLYGNRFDGTQFDTQNIVPVAGALFAVALGIAAGSLLRRTLPALAATVGIFVGVRLLVAVYLRPHYMSAITRSLVIGTDPNLPSGSWTLTRNLVDSAGNAVTGRFGVPDACATAANRQDVQACLSRLGFRDVVTYQPASRYWHFQWTEAGLFLVLAAALVTFAVVHTLRHDA